MMEISGPALTPPTPTVRKSEPTGRLAALKALQKSIDAEKKVMGEVNIRQEGKGQLLDIRC